MAARKNPKGTHNQYGPPTVERVSAAKVCDLAREGCTTEEIATMLNTSSDALNDHFAPALAAGRAGMQASLRRRQLALAMQDDHLASATNMSIWLGKQYLGQRDQHELRQQTTAVVREVLSLDDASLSRAIETLRRKRSLPPAETQVVKTVAEQTQMCATSVSVAPAREALPPARVEVE